MVMCKERPTMLRNGSLRYTVVLRTAAAELNSTLYAWIFLAAV